MSRIRMLNTRLKLGTVLAGSLFAGCGHVYAGSCNWVAGIYVCSGAAGVDTPIQLFGGASPLSVTTTADFGLNTTASVFTSLALNGSGGISYDDGGKGNDITTGTLGISATSSGGAVSIISTGTIGGGTNAAIAVFGAAPTTDITVEANETSGYSGIVASNFGTGAVTITSTGSAVGNVSVGIQGQNNSGTDVTINAVDVTGVLWGILGENFGTGSTSITSTGDVSGTAFAGIAASTAGTNLTVHAGTSVTGATGITATNTGTGASEITSTGTVTGTSGTGIAATNSGTDLTIDVVTVTGAFNGIQAINAGSGVLSITTRGHVSGANGSGVAVDAEGGLYADIVVAAGSVVEGAVAGISAVSFSDEDVFVTNRGTIQNISGLSTDLAISGFGSATEIVNTGLVTGWVSLGSLDDTFDNYGTWNTAGATNIFDAGTDQVVNEAGGTIIAAGQTGTAEATNFLNLETFSNAGRLTMQDGGAGDVTLITGNYVGNGGTLAIDTVLGSDDSLTDVLLISGNATGTTRLLVNNAGGLGARTTGNGIEVVDVSGDSSAGAFALSARLMAGAFEYGLYEGGIDGNEDLSENWYLRSQLTTGAGVYAPYTTSLLNFGRETLGTLQQRSGNKSWPGEAEAPKRVWCKDASANYQCNVTKAPAGLPSGAGGETLLGRGVWGRVGGSTASYDPQSGTGFDQDTWFVQAGYDGVLSETDKGSLLFGVFGTYGNSSSDVDVSADPVTRARRSGTIDTDGYGVGANLTWYGDDGFYADAVGQLTWYSSDLSTSDLGTLADGNDAFGYALSMEIGKRLAIGSEGWAWVPQAQLIYTSVDADGVTDTSGTDVTFGDADSLLGRAGIRLEKLTSWTEKDGSVRRFQGYGIANVSYEFLDGNETDVAGTRLTQEGQNLFGEIGLGLTYTAANRWSVFGEGSYATSLQAFGDSDLWKGNVGLRYHW